VCHGRFHDILPKEYSGTFYEVPWGLFKEMLTNTQGQSDIVIQRLISESIYQAKRISSPQLKQRFYPFSGVL